MSWGAYRHFTQHQGHHGTQGCRGETGSTAQHRVMQYLRVGPDQRAIAAEQQQEGDDGQGQPEAGALPTAAASQPKP